MIKSNAKYSCIYSKKVKVKGGGGVIYTKMLEYMTKMFCLKLSLQWDELKWLFVKNVILYIYKNETMKIFWYIRI